MATLSFSLITTATGSSRAGMASLVIFLGVGLALLLATPYPANKKS